MTTLAILDRFTTEGTELEGNSVVTSVTFDIAGGSSHEERESAALAALEAFKARSARVVPPMSYEVKNTGWTLEFRFFVDTQQQTPHVG